jgi:hypothetical protein
LNVSTSLPPFRATDFTLAPETARPLIGVVVILERANFSPAGNPTATDAILAAPWPRLILMRSLGWPVGRPLAAPLAVGPPAQFVSVAFALTVFVTPL